LGREQGRVQDLQLGAGSALAHRRARVLVQPGQHPRRVQQLQVVRQRRRVSGILELTFGTDPETRRIPLLGDPLGAPQCGLVGAGGVNRHLRFLGDLLHERGLAHLPRAGHDLDETAGLGQSAGQNGCVVALVGLGRFTQDSEYFHSIP
jgi:hypothetical protein